MTTNLDDNDRVDVLLAEYKAAQSSAEHAQSMAWTVTSVSWAASLILLGLIADEFGETTPPFFLSLLGVIGLLFTTGEWYMSKALEEVKSQKYARCRELEATLGMTQHTRLCYSSRPHKEIFLLITLLLSAAWILVIVLPWVRL